MDSTRRHPHIGLLKKDRTGWVRVPRTCVTEQSSIPTCGDHSSSPVTSGSTTLCVRALLEAQSEL